MHFNRTEAQFQHRYGQLVQYNKRVLAIAGNMEEYDEARGAAVEELNDEETEWSMHTMSPVNGMMYLIHFTALTLGSKLFIFGLIQH